MSARSHDVSGVELSPDEARAPVVIESAGWQLGAWVKRGAGYSIGIMKRGEWPIIFHELARGDLPAFARQCAEVAA